MKVPRTTGSTSAHQNQLPAMQSVATSPAIASGVSAAKVVATIEVPASHHGRVRPAAKKDSVFSDARRALGSTSPRRVTESGQPLVRLIVATPPHPSCARVTSIGNCSSATRVPGGSTQVGSAPASRLSPPMWSLKQSRQQNATEPSCHMTSTSDSRCGSHTGDLSGPSRSIG